MSQKILTITATIFMALLFLSACKNNLVYYKESKIFELQDYADSKGEINYSVYDWQAINDAVADGIQEVQLNNNYLKIMKNLFFYFFYIQIRYIRFNRVYYFSNRISWFF